MAISPKLLNQGERIVVDTRTHAKVLIGPLVVLLVTVFAAVFLGAWATAQVQDDTTQTVLGAVVGAIAAFVVGWWVLRPFVSWYFTSYTFTDRRFIQRSGFIAREGRTIPLNRISGVDFEVDVVDRLFGCGTLVVSDASEQGRVELHDIPQVERVQMVVAEELHRLSRHESRGDDGT